MRRLWLVALYVGLGASLSGGQQSGPSTPSNVANAPTAKVKVYTAGPGVTAPELLPFNPTDIPTEKCENKMDGTVTLSVLVDTTGQSRNIVFLHPLGNLCTSLQPAPYLNKL